MLVVVCVKEVKHKCMLTVGANLVVGWPLVAPFALGGNIRRLRCHFSKVFLIAVLAALERNLTNLSLYKIGGSLKKTALHGFNVIFTFLAAALSGADQRGTRCLAKCACGDNVLLTTSLVLVLGGSVVTAVVGDGIAHGADWSGNVLGVTLQLASSLAYALKFVAAKLLLGDGEVTCSDKGGGLPPSKVQIAFVVNPITGLMALAFLPFFETSLELPPLGTIMAVSLCATGILVFELRLTELTSPLTVSVLAVLHNVVIVIFFAYLGESLSHGQVAGFAVSTLGAMCYACAAKQKSRTRIAQEATEL